MKKYRIVEGSKRLIIFLPFLKEGLEFAQKYQYNEIVITSQPSDSLFGEKYTLDIDLLSEYKFIKCLILEDPCGYIEPCNINLLSEIKNLEELRIWTDNQFYIDFSYFPSLIRAEFYDSNLICNINHLINLREVHIYNLKSKELEEFSNMTNLEKITLWDASSRSLKGLSELKSIRSINLVRLKNITDLSCINKLRKLIELNLYSCNKLENINAIIDLKKLKTLRIEKCKYITDLSSIVPNNSIEFIYISTLSNLDFILQMKKLKKIVFHNLLDNDLLPLLESNTLEHASFISKKGYAYNEKEINSRLKNIRVTK